MILTRTPLRITLGGGGTDLPSFYQNYEGYVISGGINKHTYICVSTPFEKKILLKYSSYESVTKIDDINHPIIKATLSRYLPNIEQIEIASFADVCSGTGLGSSGSFTNSLIKAIHSLKKLYINPEELASNSCTIEIDDLKQPTGKQDQYATAIGGITEQIYKRDGTVVIKSLPLSSHTIQNLNSRLLLFYTNFTRSASAILQDQHNRTMNKDDQMLENMLRVKESGLKIREVLINNDYVELGHLMHDHWRQKASRSPGMSNEMINNLYRIGIGNGAIGGKVVGAGGGGFLLFVAEDPQKLRHAMREKGIKELIFNFDFEGTITCISE